MIDGAVLLDFGRSLMKARLGIGLSFRFRVSLFCLHYFSFAWSKRLRHTVLHARPVAISISAKAPLRNNQTMVLAVPWYQLREEREAGNWRPIPLSNCAAHLISG